VTLEASLDAIAVRLIDNLAANSDNGTPGLRAAFSVGSTAQGARIMPRSIDDWPVAIVWPAGGDLTAGNGPEPMLHRIEVRIWFNASEAGAATQALVPFVDRCRVLFRTDLDANATATRCLMTGYGEPEVDDAHGKPFLVLPIYLEVLDLTATSAYAV
jgi:hypothetical protein